MRSPNYELLSLFIDGSNEEMKLKDYGLRARKTSGNPASNLLPLLYASTSISSSTTFSFPMQMKSKNKGNVFLQGFPLPSYMGTGGY